MNFLNMKTGKIDGDGVVVTPPCHTKLQVLQFTPVVVIRQSDRFYNFLLKNVDNCLISCYYKVVLQSIIDFTCF